LKSFGEQLGKAVSSISHSQLTSMITAIQLAMPCWRSTRMKLLTPEMKPPSAITPG